MKKAFPFATCITAFALGSVAVCAALNLSPWLAGVFTIGAVLGWFMPARWFTPFMAFGTLAMIGIGSIAHASAVPPSLGEGGFGGALLGTLLPYLITAAGAALVAGLGYGARFLRARVKLIRNERLQSALDLIGDFVFVKVTELAQVSTAKLKAAAGDGRLTPQEAAAAAGTAAREVWASLPADIRALLVRLAGSEAAAVKAYVAPRVESTVPAMRTVNADYVGTPTLGELTAARARIGLAA